MLTEVGKNRVTGNSSLDVFELRDELWGPDDHRNRLAMIGTRKCAKFMNEFFEMRDEAAVKSGKTDKRTKGIARARKFPIANKIKFGLGGGVAIGADVVAHPFKTVHEEVAFLEVERKAIFDVDFAEATEPFEDEPRIVREADAIIDDLRIIDIVIVDRRKS